ncbi:MAG: toxin-activating lysine-acyltransferase [Hyphomicrobiaceae bacterium]
MILGKKKKPETVSETSQPTQPVAPPPVAPPATLAGQMESINTPQTQTPVPTAPPQGDASLPEVAEDTLQPQSASDTPPPDPEQDELLAKARAQLQEAFGKITLAAMSEPRYRNLAINDLATLFLEPLLQNRIAIASPANDGGTPVADAVSAIAIWASVSPEVDVKIREQIDAGTYPVRLQREDWNSGDINWLLDILSPSQRLTTAVIANFRQVLKEGEICIHPIVTRTMDKEVLDKLGARPIGEASAA